MRMSQFVGIFVRPIMQSIAHTFVLIYLTTVLSFPV